LLVAPLTELELIRFRGIFPFAEKDPTIAKHRAYPPEFRAKIIELARSGKSVSSIAQEYDVARLAISNWLKQDDLDAGDAIKQDGGRTFWTLTKQRLKKDLHVISSGTDDFSAKLGRRARERLHECAESFRRHRTEHGPSSKRGIDSDPDRRPLKERMSSYLFCKI